MCKLEEDKRAVDTEMEKMSNQNSVLTANVEELTGLLEGGLSKCSHITATIKPIKANAK